jgi:hypothetical protein
MVKIQTRLQKSAKMSVADMQKMSAADAIWPYYSMNAVQEVLSCKGLSEHACMCACRCAVICVCKCVKAFKTVEKMYVCLCMCLCMCVYVCRYV